MNNKIRLMLDKAAARNPIDVNTDWDGTLLITAILDWHKTIKNPLYADFAAAWFKRHRDLSHSLSDEQVYASYSGIRSRIIRDGPIPFTAYCGHWGLAYACDRLASLIEDPEVRDTADAVASYILHRAPRSRHGCAYHDDDAHFLIPDTCYFAAPVMAIAAHLTDKKEYIDHAVSQLCAYIALMQDSVTGLAFTMWSEEAMPRNFWSRASGWLAGALANTLEYIPQDHPAYDHLIQAYKLICDALLSVQRTDGGFHVLLDRPDLPVDSTAPAMVAFALHKGVRLGWLDESYLLPSRLAWEACLRFVTDEGEATGAYTGWAMTALEQDFSVEQFDAKRDFVTGLILLAGAEMELSC